MNISDFQLAGSGDPAPGGDVEPLADGSVTPLPGQEEEQFTTSVTPSGIEVYYSWAPRRHYKLRADSKLYKDNGAWFSDQEPHEWQEVPSVTTVLGVLDKSGPLTYWAMRVGADGVRQLASLRSTDSEIAEWITSATVDSLVEELVANRLTVNHQKDKAADRGVNVHNALEAWIKTINAMPDPTEWPESERGYIAGLRDFLEAINYAAIDVDAELMVGSLQHQYAGRFDLVLTLSKPVEVVTKCYPKKPPKVEEIPAGRYLLDLKTSKRVYDTHYLQLEAYEYAAVECGYQPTDYRGVVHVTADGKYELVMNKDWTFQDFLAVRQCYQVMHERKIVQALRDELDAKDVS